MPTKQKTQPIKAKTGQFHFTVPRVITGKSWYVYYTIKYLGQKTEYRHDKGGKRAFNRIKDLTERLIQVDAYIAQLIDELKDGIDMQRVDEARAVIAENAEEKLKYEVQTIYDKWWTQAGYVNPTDKQKHTAANFENLFLKRFLPYLREKKLMKDIREIKKIHIKEFLNKYQFEKKVWSRNTTRVKNQWLGAFFRYAVEHELIEHNPTHGIHISGQKSAKKARFQVFTKQEVSIIFEEIEQQTHYLKLELLIKLIYYGFFRITESLRLEVNNIDLVNKYIIVRPEQSKTGDDGITRNVLIHPELMKVLRKYLDTCNALSINDKLFFKDRITDKTIAITDMTMRAYWRDFMDVVKQKYPNHFNRNGLSLYSFKHSGVTHFYNDGINKVTSQKVIDFIRKQCRHKSILTTEIYLRDDLGIDIDGNANFFEELGLAV